MAWNVSITVAEAFVLPSLAGFAFWTDRPFPALLLSSSSHEGNHNFITFNA